MLERAQIAMNFDKNGENCFFFPFQEHANFHNANKTREIYDVVKAKILEEINQPNSGLTYSHLSSVFSTAKENAFDEVIFFRIFS